MSLHSTFIYTYITLHITFYISHLLEGSDT